MGEWRYHPQHTEWFTRADRGNWNITMILPGARQLSYPYRGADRAGYLVLYCRNPVLRQCHATILRLESEFDDDETQCDSSLMMEAVRTSETSVDNHFTRQYNPEDSSEHHVIVHFEFRHRNLVLLLSWGKRLAKTYSVGPLVELFSNMFDVHFFTTFLTKKVKRDLWDHHSLCVFSTNNC
jgi:hypothetical protein